MDERTSHSPDQATLTRERIVHAAIRLVDSAGLDALSMRRLGAQLGVEAMALYRHVDGREDLLEAMVDQLTSSVRLSPQMELGPDEGWNTYLQQLAHEVRAVATAHPHIFPLIATRHPAAPWLRPPLRSLRMVEDFLTTLGRFGFDDDRAVAAYRSFTSFLIGQLLLDVAQQGAPTTALPLGQGQDRDGAAGAALAAFPEVQRLEDKLSEDRSSEEFQRALEHLLDRVGRDLAT